MYSARDIANLQLKKRKVKKELYKTILEGFSKKIKIAAESGQQQVFLTVPEFVVGYPVFDPVCATGYLIRQLERLGYTATRYGPTEIYITWGVVHGEEEEPVKEDIPVFANLRKIADNIRKNHS